MFSQIKEQNNLDCTEEQFNTYIEEQLSLVEPLAISLKKYSFDELYNGHQIENIFNDDNARYYVLSIEGGNTYLQYHIPYVEGIQMITDDNFDEVSSEHARQLADQYTQYESFQNAIEHFKVA